MLRLRIKGLDGKTAAVTIMADETIGKLRQLVEVMVCTQDKL